MRVKQERKQIYRTLVVFVLLCFLPMYSANVRFSVSGRNHSDVLFGKASHYPPVHIDIKIGYMTGSYRKPGDQEYSRPGLTISGGLTYALSDLQETPFFGRHINVNFILIVAETSGDEETSLKQVASLWQTHNVSVIIGPQETCLHEARLAASLNIPMISYFCSDEQTSDKSLFPTFSRTRPPDAAISRAVASLVLKFGWLDSLAVIYSDSTDDQRFKRVAKSLSILFKDKGVTTHPEIAYRGPYHAGYGENPFDAIISRTKETTRIYIVISEYFEHMGFMLAMKNHDLLEKGDYLVIGVSMDDFKEEVWNSHRFFCGLLSDVCVSPDVFRSYLGILASPPRNFSEFSRRVNHFMEREPFNIVNPLAKLDAYKKIRIEAAYLYDAVFLYANAVRSIIREANHDIENSVLSLVSSSLYRKDILKKIFDGREISRRLRNVTYRSATGHVSEMDENGDAEGNFTLISIKMKDGELGLYPVGFFMRSAAELPELTLTESINWVGDSPPVSQPECGFFGEKCKRDNNSIMATGLLMLAIIFVGAGVYLIFRHWRLSRDMDTLLWKIDRKDIQWETGPLFPIGGKGVGSGSQASLARFSSVFAPLVRYRERIFAAKVVNVDLLDNAMKLQLKMLREIRHENLNAFIGACIYDDSLLLVNEYCSRGSIKDILENGDLKLDDMFVSSLVGDLLRGLSYIHDSSQFRYHGNLKPANCLIDSRWVLKLADFGLKKYEIGLKRMSEIMEHPPAYNLVTSTGGISTIGGGHSGHGPHGSSFSRASHTFTSSFTNHQTGSTHASTLSSTAITSPYLAPEYPLIRKGQMKSCAEGYRKGDVYSLGVILWELLRRESLSNFLGIKEEANIREEICRRYLSPCSELGDDDKEDTNISVFWKTKLALLSNSDRNGNKNDGSLHSAQVIECLKDCLGLEPELRPDIKSVRLRLRPLHKGMRSNIFDTMIGLMEKYANNLEILVDERTKQLSEEKRKTESLLYELIPACVAEQLKEGLKVSAQNYDCVSIYFSDIVGFTSMSAQSTALQVVEFLNDLYTCFDSVIEKFDVYKVETIGDAYMVASGLPVVRDGNFHAVEMARMALQLLQAVTNFQIRHIPNECVKLRIGIHSGPCCAGVVGLKRPRYCLFGDTVNTASRMESTGLPLRIHCSQAFAELIDDCEEFHLEKRGVVDVKGKGDMTTFWLLGFPPVSCHDPISSSSNGC